MSRLATPSQHPFAADHTRIPAPAADTAPQRWQQVLARDPDASGRFVYAVRTTGIYCRPTCPSRRPAAHNVLFFCTPAQARTAGFRPCLRCTPDASEAPESTRAAAIRHAARILTGDTVAPLGLAELARHTGLDRLALLRGFRQLLGLTPGEFARACRLARLRDDLTADPAPPSDRTITDAIYAAGFGSSSRVYEHSSDTLGMPPGSMRRGALGLTLRYTTADSPLGLMLVAATETGVCAILFGDSPAELAADLQRRFRNAQLAPAPLPESPNTGPDTWLAEAVAFVASQLTEHPLARTFPLHIRATAFQQRVWDALLAIPRGDTRCYSDLAREIGRPHASRAVGAAIGANPLAVVVPCHRAVGKNGSLTGYHWGLDRKRRLLAAEQPPAPTKPRP